MKLGFGALEGQSVFYMWKECKLLWPEGNCDRLYFPKIAAPIFSILYALLQSDLATPPVKGIGNFLQ